MYASLTVRLAKYHQNLFTHKKTKIENDKIWQCIYYTSRIILEENTRGKFISLVKHVVMDLCVYKNIEQLSKHYAHLLWC